MAAIRLSVWFLLVAALGPTLGCGSSDPGPAQGKPPNIVFILADDLGWRDLSGEGSRYYESPHIDRIAREGMRFTRGYATSSVCSPSRASILTGKYPPNHGITTWIGEVSSERWRSLGRNDSLLPPDYERALRASEVTLAEALHEAGYRTFFAGKWHLGGDGSLPTDHGFEVNLGGWEVGRPIGGYFAPWENPKLPRGRDGESLPIRLAQEAVKFIESNRDRPFFVYLSFYSVHGPLQTTRELWKKYRDKAQAAGPASERFRLDRGLAVRQVQDLPVFAGMIESMDAAVGIVLEALDQLRLADRTIVVFSSDNGGVSSGGGSPTSNLPLRGGKGRQWEGGIRAPFYIKAAGISEPGSSSDVPVSGIDFYPTLLDLAGLELSPEQAVDGVSLVPLLEGASIADRPLFWHYPHYGNNGGEPSSILIEAGWKLIHYYEDGRDELYDLEHDEGEQRDLAKDEPARVRAMRERLDAWLRSTDATLPTDDPRHDPERLREARELKRKNLVRTLEKQHARYLDPDFQPDKRWWGSRQPGD